MLTWLLKQISHQTLIQDYLYKLFPKYKFIGEESNENDYNSFHTSTCWVVDPIDGTTNFVHGIPFICVSIALCKQGIPVLGVIYNPISQELFTAIKGNGAYYNSLPLKPKPTSFDSLERMLVSTEYGVTRDEVSLSSKTNTITQVLKENVRGIRAIGSSALASCYVAKHSLDAFWEAGIHLWDICAACVIVGETGGCIVNWDTKRKNNGFRLVL